MSGVSVSMRHGGLSALCHRYPDRPPILALWDGGVHVTVTADPDGNSGSIGELISAVEKYAAALVEWKQRRDECGCGRPAVTA